MKQRVQNLLQNEWFALFMNGVFAYITFVALVIGVLQVPPETILDSGLDQVLLVFEEFP
jgi:hypothetical protein